MALHNLLGKAGEEAAVNYLREHGYRILDTNWHSGHKELDIVAEYNQWLIIVEVKTRSNNTYQDPWEAVTPVKMKRIVQSAHHYIKMHSIDRPVRFDILSLIPKDNSWEIEHFEDAFVAPLLITGK